MEGRRKTRCTGSRGARRCPTGNIAFATGPFPTRQTGVHSRISVRKPRGIRRFRYFIGHTSACFAEGPGQALHICAFFSAGNRVHKRTFGRQPRNGGQVRNTAAEHKHKGEHQQR